MTWAAEQRAGGPSAKATLWAIANIANQDDVAWPSQQLLAEQSEQSIDSVGRRLGELAEQRLLRRIPLKFAGRKTVDFLILARSRFFTAALNEIEPLLPRGCVVDPRFNEPDAPADCGSALPQTLPQSAADAPAMVREQEPVMEPEEPKIEREARAREQDPDPRPWERDKHFSSLIERYPGIHSPNLAWPAWQRLDDEGRRRALSRLDTYLAERRKVRNETVFALQNYLGQRLFDQAPEPEAGQPVMTLAKARSKEFWWLLQRKAERGERIKFAFELSRDHGHGLQISIAETREFEQTGVMHEIETGGEAFEAWRRWFEGRGIRFRSTDTHICGKFIYVPSEWPPGWAHGPPQAEGERAEELETAESGEADE
jgi:hypothetical protein